MAYESMWDDSSPYLSQLSSSQESLDAYSDKGEEHGLVDPDTVESNLPAPQYDARMTNSLQFSGGPASTRPPLPTSQSGELAHALDKPDDTMDQEQDQCGDEMLELHHALAAYVEHPSIAELAPSCSVGTFAVPGQEDDAHYKI